ncbi:hypothetical protein F5890DRAFT_1385950, partial [Lentinula detonsa]
RICSTSKCRTQLPPEAEYKHKTCQKCRELDRIRKQKKRAEEKTLKRSREESEDEDVPVNSNDTHPIYRQAGLYTRYPNAETLFKDLRAAIKHDHTEFGGEFTLPPDPMITDKERVRMMISDVWKATGYRFTVHDNRPLETGHKTILWCSQGAEHKRSRKGEQEGIVHRDTVGMCRYACRGQLTVTSKDSTVSDTDTKRISVRVKHYKKHIPYYDVSMPEEATEIIRDNLLTST